MKDAVIGVIKNTSWPYIRNYAISLAKCGFNGHKVLFINDITEEARKKLVELDFVLVDYDVPGLKKKEFNSWEGDPLAWGFFGRVRFLPVIEWLSPRIAEYRNIVWCDVRDVLFQTDPSIWLEENITPVHKLFGASEGCLIKDQSFNANWVQRTSPKDWKWMKEEVVCCSGTFAGTAHIMLEVFKRMYQLHLDIKDPAAFDQGLWNFTARSYPFKEYFRIPRMKEGFVATGWPSKETAFSKYTTDDAPVWDWNEMVCYAPETKIPFAIVHQYEREPAWANQINSIFQDAPPIILIASYEAARHNGYQQAARDTWIAELSGRMPYKFVLGRECKDPGPDEIVVDAPDGIEGFPLKTRAARAWATKSGFGYTFHCTTDTYIIVERFLLILYERFDCLGYFMYDMNRLCKTENVQFPQGGAGYWLSPKAAEAIEKATPKDWVGIAEDVFVGDVILHTPGLICGHSEGFWPRRNLEKDIPTTGEYMTLHLSFWDDREPKYLAAWMNEAHAVWGNIKEKYGN